VLFLDELPEFERRALESLRQVLEERRIAVARAGREPDATQSQPHARSDADAHTYARRVLQAYRVAGQRLWPRRRP